MDDSALTEPNETRLEGNEPTALSGNNKVDFTDITEDDSQERKEKKVSETTAKKVRRTFCLTLFQWFHLCCCQRLLLYVCFFKP